MIQFLVTSSISNLSLIVLYQHRAVRNRGLAIFTMVYISILDLHFPDYAAVFSVATLLRLIGLWTTYKILVAIYNISPLHPLSKFPGTKLARMTLCYEAWFDLVKTGRYTREIRKMHKKYG